MEFPKNKKPVVFIRRNYKSIYLRIRYHDEKYDFNLLPYLIKEIDSYTKANQVEIVEIPRAYLFIESSPGCGRIRKKYMGLTFSVVWNL